MKKHTFASLALIVLIALIPLLVFAGCAMNSTTSGMANPNPIGTVRPPDAKPATVGGAVSSEMSMLSVAGGVWEVDLQYSNHVSKLTMRLKQTGNVVEGTIDVFTGHKENYSNVPVLGKLEGNKLSLKIPSFAYGYITATVVGNRLEDGYYHGQTNYGARFIGRKVND